MIIKHYVKEILSFLKSPKGYIKTKRFITCMNQTAKSLGMNNSFFDSASGASYFSYSTASDLYKLSEAAFSIGPIRSFCSFSSAKLNGHDIKNTSYISASAIFNCPLSLKTGTFIGNHKAICLQTDCSLLCILTDDSEASSDIFGIAAKIINGTYVPGENIAYFGIIDGQTVAHNQNKRFLPASTVKLLTALCAYNICQFSGSVKIGCGDFESGSGSRYRVGEIFTLSDAVQIMLMESSNTIARAIARTCGLMF